MVYFNKLIFKNILSYCGDEEIVKLQKQRLKIILEDINQLDYYPNFGYDMMRGIFNHNYLYKNYIDYDFVYYPRHRKILESNGVVIVYKGFIFPNISNQFGTYSNPITRLISIANCLRLKKKDSLMEKIKFAKNFNRLDCDCCNGVNKTKMNKQILLCELLNKDIEFDCGSTCLTGLCEEIRERL
jgi:hypothetical protein